jgi:hypothetical protein
VVDRAVSSAHGSTVDQTLKAKGYAIWAIHVRSNGPGGPQAECGVEHTEVKDGAAVRGGASPAQSREKAPGRHFERGWVLRIAGKLTHTPRGSGRKHWHPRWPAPEGGRSASPASSRGRCCAQEQGKGARRFCSPRNDASKMFTGEDRAAAVMISDGGGSGGAPEDRVAAPVDD